MWSTGIEKKDVSKVASLYKDEKILNPKAYGGTDSTGKVAESKQEMFDGKGQINAYDLKDAITQQQHFAANKAKYQRKASASMYTPEEKSRIIESAFGGDESEKLRFGAQMIPLILDRLDYEGFGRQVLRTHELAQGQINSYEKDINVSALVIQDDGQTVETVVKGQRVFVPEFWITAFPKINLSEIATRQFDIVDRTHDKATFQIMLAEDRAILKALYAASTTENSQINITSTVNKSVFETVQYEVERHRLLADKFLINRQELGDLKKNMNVIDYDPITARDVLMTGLFGTIWGVNIFVSAGHDEQGLQNVAVPEGFIFCVTEPRYIGVLPIRISLKMLPADQFYRGAFQYGYLFGELLGCSILNSRSVAVGIKSGYSAPSWMQ